MISIFIIKLKRYLLRYSTLFKMRNNSYNAPLYRMMRAKKVQKAVPVQKRIQIQKPIIMPPIVIVPPFFVL